MTEQIGDYIKKVRNSIEQSDFETALDLLQNPAEESWSQTVEAMYLTAIVLGNCDRLSEAAMYAQIVGMHPRETNPDVIVDCLTILAKALMISDVKTILMSRHQLFLIADLAINRVTQLVAIANAAELFDLAERILDSKKDLFDDQAKFFLLKAGIARSTNNIEQEKEFLISALHSNPKDASVHASIAHLFDRFKEFDASAEHNSIAEQFGDDGRHPNIAMAFFLASISKGVFEQERLKNLWLNQLDADQSFRAPFGLLNATDDPELILEENKRFSIACHINADRSRNNGVFKKSKNHSTIRIGYFSPDFRNHAVTHLINDLIHSHDQSQFETFGFSIANFESSQYRDSLREGFNEFYEVESASNEEIISKANSLELDFAVDLAGYTQGFRPQLMERIKNAYIINFLGYPSTIGASFYDFIIGDSIVTPPGSEKYFSEEIIRLDRSYQCNSPSRNCHQVDRHETNLPEDSFVFCNFNARQKLNLPTLEAWSEIIAQCPDSVLWLLEPGVAVKEDIKTIFKKNSHRVIFAPMSPVEYHLGRIKHANLFLDSFPYGAHTTASDAIYSGIPILTISGRAFQSRVSWSLMHHSGLNNLNCFDWDDFITKGVEFYHSHSPDKGKYYQDILLDRKKYSHPYNVNGYAREYEEKLIKIMER